jgi:hypothetical protein
MDTDKTHNLKRLKNEGMPDVERVLAVVILVSGGRCMIEKLQTAKAKKKQ